MAKILVIEDNFETQLLLRRALRADHEITIASTLKSGWDHLEKNDCDIVILDRVLPDGDGIEICQKIKELHQENRFSVLMLSAHGELEEKVLGLSAGADDYLVKPFEPRELLARISAVQRRSRAQPTSAHMQVEDLTFDIENRRVHIAANANTPTPTVLELTPIEFKILFSLAKGYGHAIERGRLRQMVWSGLAISDRNIDTHICHLRKKIENSCLTIKNKRNEGYHLFKQIQNPPARLGKEIRLPSRKLKVN